MRLFDLFYRRISKRFHLNIAAANPIRWHFLPFLLIGFDDLFVVKYDAAFQKELVRHFDGGDVSFMIALSSTTDYDGGGTQFDCLEEEVVHLDCGDVILFDADLYHQGLSITRGTRYLLVGFCVVDDGSKQKIIEAGYINLSLRSVKHGKRKHIVDDGKGVCAGGNGTCSTIDSTCTCKMHNSSNQAKSKKQKQKQKSME